MGLGDDVAGAKSELIEVVLTKKRVYHRHHINNRHLLGANPSFPLSNTAMSSGDVIFVSRWRHHVTYVVCDSI